MVTNKAKRHLKHMRLMEEKSKQNAKMFNREKGKNLADEVASQILFDTAKHLPMVL